MITFCNIYELEAVNCALKQLKQNHQTLYQKLEEIVHLTRALNFKYHYMGALLMDESSEPYAPESVHNSVLKLYQKQLLFLKESIDFKHLKDIFTAFKKSGYGTISLLILGIKPESLVGASHIR